MFLSNMTKNRQPLLWDNLIMQPWMVYMIYDDLLPEEDVQK